MSETLKRYLPPILKEHGSLQLQGIGSLHLAYTSAQVDQRRGFVTPPQEQIYFTPRSEAKTDPVLVRVIEMLGGVEADESQQLTEDFMQELSIELSKSGKLTLPAIGTIKRNFWGAHYFEPALESAGLNRFFGLPTQQLPQRMEQVTTEEPQVSRDQPLPKEEVLVKGSDSTSSPSRRIATERRITPWGFLLGLAGVILIAMSIWYISRDRDQVPSDDVASQTRPELQSDKRVNVAPLEEVEEEAHTPPPLIIQQPKPSNDYTIIVGAFGNSANVARMVERLESLGLKPYVQQGSLTKVGFSFSGTSDSLATKLAWSKENLNADAWVLP